MEAILDLLKDNQLLYKVCFAVLTVISTWLIICVTWWINSWLPANALLEKLQVTYTDNRFTALCETQCSSSCSPPPVAAHHLQTYKYSPHCPTPLFTKKNVNTDRTFYILRTVHRDAYTWERPRLRHQHYLDPIPITSRLRLDTP